LADDFFLIDKSKVNNILVLCKT